NVDLAARSARAKQEAEVADDEYRRAIHWLWGLRSRRIKVLEDGYNNLEHIAFETTETVKRVLVKYTDTAVTILCTMHNDLATHARCAVEKISAETDTSALAASLHSSFALSIPPRTLYHNYDVGECPDLVFGLSLADYATARESRHNVPNILGLCIEEVDKRGLEAEGIYTLSRQHASVQELQRKVERDERAFSFNSDADDIHTVASLLKLYLKVLPDPLFSFRLQDRIQHSRDLASHIANGFVLLRSRIRGLPAVHRASLGALLWHLSRVASRSNKNRMDSKNLAFVFTPLVFGNDEILQGGFGQSMQDSVMETLIDNAHVLLDECPPFTSPSPSPIYPREGTPVILPVMDGDSSATSTISFSRFEDLTPQPNPQSSSHTRSPGSLYGSTLSTPPMSPSGSSVYEDLSGGHTPTQAPAPLLPQLPDFPELQIFTESSDPELPVRMRVRVFPDDATGIYVADPTPNLHPQPAGSMCIPDRSNLSIPRPRSAIDSLRRRSPAQATVRPLTPDISSLRTFTETPERHSQEQDVTRLGTQSANASARSRYPSEVSLVPSLPRFVPQQVQRQQQRRPPPLSIPGTASTRTTITDHRRSSATSLASRSFAFPGSFHDS
ncbi:Rho GTPase activation protein, partial [Lactarius sanguifluus]